MTNQSTIDKLIEMHMTPMNGMRSWVERITL